MLQLVQYPGFARIGAAEFKGFHAHHCRSIGWVVGPLMVAKLLTGLLLAAVGHPGWFWRGMFGLLLVIWFSTGFSQGPWHRRLAREGPGPELIVALVRGNWLRTAAWTARAAGLLWF